MKTMTMADAGAVQLEEQEKWFAAHPDAVENDVETDDHTDEAIRRELIGAGIGLNDYETEFSEQTFREAVQAGMDRWVAEQTRLPERVLVRWNAEDWNDRTMEASKYRYYVMDDEGHQGEELDLTEEDLKRYSFGQAVENLRGGSQGGTLDR